MRYFLAVLACGVLFIYYNLLGAVLGWKHGGGIIPMAILLSLIFITWRSITKKDKKQVDDDTEARSRGLQREEAIRKRQVDDDTEAVKLFRKTAEQGDALAQFSLGNCYYFGDGVTQDYVEAVKWLRRAAEQGLSSAQVALGNCYTFGRGVGEDYAEAEKWYRKAAKQGNPEAKAALEMIEVLGSFR